jgi:hypothetical protein
LRAIFGEKAGDVRDASLPAGIEARRRGTSRFSAARARKKMNAIKRLGRAGFQAEKNLSR